MGSQTGNVDTIIGVEIHHQVVCICNNALFSIVDSILEYKDISHLKISTLNFMRRFIDFSAAPRSNMQLKSSSKIFV